MKKRFLFSVILLVLFVIWTLLVIFVDVKSIGPHNSKVGFSSINQLFHSATGTNITLYTITDWLGLVPVTFALGFASLGLIQWIKRKNILKVDFSLLILGIFYIVVFAAYFLFEVFIVNYRPILINGILEASYPSSTTLLVLCIIPTTIMQLNSRIKKKSLKNIICLILALFAVFMVVARTLSGVHWLTDIIGGALLSTGLVSMYRCISKAK